MYFNNSNHLLTVNIIELSANFITKIFCLDFLALASILNEYYWNPLISRLFPIGMYSSSVRVSFGAFFFSKFILLLFATLLLPLGTYCYSGRNSVLPRRARESRKSAFERIPSWKSFADRWNSQMLARYTVLLRYASLSQL